ncbi:glycosyltransferase [Nakamurella deserti]|uniref:glycosyltransferase family 2 protein n=1 Tax=Nakamurella deserti TaxID=2164074 RepID=UPI000DBEA8CE|nr:cellulose synthase catalytic subunit [Nakamurella deserti]
MTLTKADLVPPPPLYAVPPTDAEKHQYIKGSQHRWFFWAHAVAFLGIAVSLYGFATMRYWTLIFLAPLALYAAETLLGLRTSTYPRRVTLPDHRFLVETYDPEEFPSVDVYLPTCGESPELLANTLHWISQLEWQGELTTWVLDDKASPEVRELAESYGVRYLARPGSEFKKAGNLQYAFERSTGSLILILDADFVPRADLLTEVVPYFSDHSIGIVQTPQLFSTGKHLSWLTRGAGATQEMFYRFIQPSRDAVRAAICCGTSAVYRRRALDAIGGFPRIAHSEDVFTGMAMEEKGFRLQYVPLNLSQGLSPDSVNSFITQQYRWCEGSMAMAAGSDFHVSALSRPQRLSYWSGFSYYLTTAMNVFLAPIPTLLMVWLFPEYVKAGNFLPLVGLLVLWLGVYPVVMKGRWRLETLRVQVIYGFAHAASIWDVFFGQTQEWVPTGGGSAPTPVATRVKRMIVWYLSITMAAASIGLVYRLWSGYPLSDWWAALVFFGVNLYIFVPVVAACTAQESAPRRRRLFTRRPSVIEVSA